MSRSLRRRSTRRLDFLLGMGAIAVVVAIALVAVASYNKVFVPSDSVTLDAGIIGNALQKGSDVKLNGVPVGSVRAVQPIPGGARLTLGIDPSVMKDIPVGARAQLLPKTMFGERYVSLTTSSVTGPHLEPGATIFEDTSAPAVELQRVFDKMLPLLRSIQPDKLASMMGSMATALHDRGNDIGLALSDWASYLHKLNPHVPTMADDFARLASVARTYQSAAPDIVAALDNMVTTSRTMVAETNQLRQLYATVITSSNTTQGWVAHNENTIEILSDRSRRALSAVAPYAAEFPCVFAAARTFIPRMDTLLGKGTDEPGIHVKLSIVASRGKYLPGRDAPVWQSGKAPRCPYVTGQTGTRPARIDGAAQPAQIAPPPNLQLQRQVLSEGAGLGEQNSPAENQMIAELLAPSAGMSPQAYPKWASLMVGPLLRGRGVVIQ